MAMKRFAAIIYAIVSLGVVAFQIAFAAGAPWGAYAMGGAFPGQFPLHCESLQLSRRCSLQEWLPLFWHGPG